MQYNRKLQQVVKVIDSLIKGFAPDGSLFSAQPLIKALMSYADIIEPWAKSVAEYMLADVNRRNLRAWTENSDAMSRAMRAEIAQTPVGAAYRGLLAEQVTLIKSLPLKAAENVHALVQEGMLHSTRSTTIAKEILQSSSVPKWRAKLIARTEVSRSAVTLTQVRAQSIGSKGYIWRTVHDGDVRPTHKALEGVYVPWDQPPKTDKSLAPYHAGCGPNCFIGSTPISLANGVHTLWRAAFDGEVVSLVIEGQVVTVTLNHPILTPHGWVAAGLLKQGDQVVTVGQHAVDAVGDDEDEMVTFEDLHLSFRVGADRLSDGTVLDFHGDVVNEQVDQVGLEWVLSHNSVPGICEQFRQFFLSGSNGVGTVELLKAGHADPARLRGLLVAFYVSLARHCESVRLTSGADGDTVSTQQLVDGERRSRVLAGKCAGANSAEVTARHVSLRKIAAVMCRSMCVTPGNDDTSGTQEQAQRVGTAPYGFGSFTEIAAGSDQCLRVIDSTVRKRFSGHVFTVETASGWFGVTAAEIVSKNCRCFPEPIFPEF